MASVTAIMILATDIPHEGWSVQCVGQDLVYVTSKARGGLS